MPHLSLIILSFTIVVSACTIDETEGTGFTSPAQDAVDSGSSSAAGPGGDGAPADAVPAFVVHVDDGDSIIVTIEGREERVRLIGINAPEQGECVADVAREGLTDLIEGREVLLEADAEDTDRFGRLLRYVWIEGTPVNETMAERGLALARPFEPNIARQAQIGAAGERARASRLGMWDPDACGPATNASIELVDISPNPPGRDQDNLTGEYVVFVNTGDRPLNMGGFTLRDGSSTNRYEFRAGFLADPDISFSVVVGCGTNTSQALYWCSDGPVWNNSGDEIFLTDPNGNVVFFESY